MGYKIENLKVIYDIDKESPTIALNNINIDIESTGFIGIMGPSGSGKSSLLYAMAGLRKATSGNIYYNKDNICVMDKSSLAKLRKKEFGFIFQRHFLIDYMTVLENVLVPLNDDSKESREKAMDILSKLGIDNLANKKPTKLSGGQRQRVAIARGLINDPKVVFGDELTAALDHSSAEKVMDLLNSYKENMLIVIVTHDKSILKHADRIVNIWDGEIRSIEERERNTI